ncbi:MAG: four helix bundle protein, partial [Thermoflexales bacterium]|nr:four helix bundle protein [Thermoflexales bacterium]
WCVGEIIVTQDEWLTSVPVEITGDPLWRMEVYRLALFMSDIAWPDACKLMQNHSTLGLSDQLYRATGSISANIAEGYSRQSGKDQARYYEYALGSARESRTWYYQPRHIFTDQVVLHRIKLLTSIIQLLMTMIPAERGYKLLEAHEPYEVDLSTLLNDIPFA